MTRLNLSVVQIDAEFMATVRWPRNLSIVYTSRLSDRTWLKSISPQMSELAFN